MRALGLWVGLAVAIVGCDDPSGTGYLPPETTDDSVLFPDLVDTADPGPDTTPVDTTPVDTTPVDTTAPDTTPVDTTPIDTAETSTCPEGQGCDDRDPCTTNDRCQGGMCRGDALSCNDNVPCTEDLCSGGLCQHPVRAGACLVDGTCYSDAQLKADNACLRCDSTQSKTAWTPLAGVKCDDGDACTDGETCNGGVCGNGVPVAACLLPPICTYHTDCYPERVCGLWFATGEKRCSDPCAGDLDCGAGKICSKVPGSVQVGYCQDAPPGALNGQPCSEDSQCRSRICSDGMCTPTCFDENNCAAAGMTCHAVGDLAAGLVQTTCAPDVQGSVGLGAQCTPDQNNYGGEYCASGHCDLMVTSFSAAVCAPVCKSEADCPPAQECNVVLFGTTDRQDSLPYDPLFTAKTRDAIAACYTPAIPGGTLADGTVCSKKEQCRSNKCLPLTPGNNTTYCTGFCTTDAQCPGNMACKLEVLNMASDWLIAAGQAAPGAYSMVRVCKFR